jgi:hypothetical protein
MSDIVVVIWFRQGAKVKKIETTRVRTPKTLKMRVFQDKYLFY